MNTIQFNKFSHLHNGSNIIFTHGNYIDSVLEKIRKTNIETVLISGNCDWSLTERYLNNIPHNIIHWYSQNVLIQHEKITAIPLGLMSSVPAQNPIHGCVWSWAPEKNSLIQKYIDIKKEPTKFIYGNFNVTTNKTIREPLANLCSKIEFIDWSPSTLNYEHFLNDIKDHEMVVCPVGNGPDVHRFYEILYMDRIPIVFNEIMYKNLWKHFPCVLLNSIEQLLDKTLLQKKLYDALKFKETFSTELLTQEYWNDKILENKL